MILALVATAWADPVILVLREDDRAFNGAFPRGTLVDAAGTSVPVDPQDGGAAPDAVRGDGIFTGAAEGLGAGPYLLRVTDGGDRRVWSGTFPLVGDPPALLVSVQPEGVITALAAGELAYGAPSGAGATATAGAPPAGDAPPGAAATPGDDNPPSEAPASGGAGPGAAPPNSSPSSSDPAADEPFSADAAARAVAWLLLVVAAGWVLAGSRRFSLAAIEAVPGESPPLRPGLARAEGDWRVLVRRMAGPARVLLVGAHDPGAVPAGTVFSLGAGPVEVAEVEALVGALAPSGPPLVVVLVGGPLVSGTERGAAAEARLADRLPRLDIRSFDA